jgi:signal transduction histidine kinase
MNRPSWQWLGRWSRLFAAPRPASAQQAQRTLTLQRDVVLPAKFVVIGVAFYYLYLSPWMDEAATTYGMALGMVQNFFGFYIILNVAAAAALFVVRRFPEGFVQWMVFAIGLVDGVFLGGLTVLTGGFDSILYWVFPGVMVINAISIPLATPQIVLNLALSAFFLGAGILENEIHGETPLQSTYRLTRTKALSEEEIRDLLPFAIQLRQQADPASRFLWRRLSESTRQNLQAFTGTNINNAELQMALARELGWPTRTIPNYGVAPLPAPDVAETPTEPNVLRVVVLWLFTFCCYGVQVLFARQQLAEEEQKEFITRTEQLRAAGRLAAEFAHQIKNPLAIINNAAFSLQRALRAGKPDLPKQFAIIQEEIAHADQIITEVMGYAQLNEGRVEKLDVIEELNRALEQIFPQAIPCGIRIHRRFSENFPPLLMQRRHLSETFVNLLKNAREALPDKGNVYITAGCRRDDSVEITIRDDGPGVAPDKLERIFEAYYSTKERGTGLGLAIVKHNVELYGGTVRVESELGKGAKFIVVFPAKVLIQPGP